MKEKSKDVPTIPPSMKRKILLQSPGTPHKGGERKVFINHN
jgi:hypothetical protein